MGTHAVASAPRRSRGQQALTVAAMAFALLLTIGVSIPANAFGVDGSAAAGAAGAGAGSGSAPGHEHGQSARVSGSAGELAFSRDPFSVSLPAVPRVAVSSAGEPTVAGVASIPAPGPVRWPTDASPLIGHGVSEAHHGQDLLIAQGTPVRAIADGTVLVSTTEGSYGQYVVLRSTVAGHEVISLYAHLGIGSQTVSVGQNVVMGQTLGLVGSSGAATGYLLYLRILQDGQLCDTITYIRGNPTRGAAPHA